MLAIILASIGFLLPSQIVFGGNENTAKNATEILAEKFYEKPKGVVRVATMNSHDFYAKDRTIYGVLHKAKPLKERQAIQEIMKLVQPDVLLIQEVGEEEDVQLLSNNLKEVGVSLPHTAFMKGRDAHHRLAILSNIPFQEILQFPMKDNMTRGILGVRIKEKSGDVEFYSAHLKSRIARSNKDPGSREERFYEARYVREILEKRKNGWILGGDFNDVPESDAIGVLLEGGFATRLEAHDTDGETWTYRNVKRHYEYIFDHILVSKKIFPYYVPNSAHVVEPKLAEAASDHRVVFADFCFNRK